MILLNVCNCFLPVDTAQQQSGDLECSTLCLFYTLLFQTKVALQQL